jgi:hypothetical protein
MKIKLLIIALISVGITACGQDYSSIPRGVKDKLDIKILTMSDEETDIPKNFSVLCIDGVKYLMTNQGGITVKFQSNQDGDPSPEECE